MTVSTKHLLRARAIGLAAASEEEKLLALLGAEVLRLRIEVAKLISEPNAYPPCSCGSNFAHSADCGARHTYAEHVGVGVYEWRRAEHLLDALRGVVRECSKLPHASRTKDLEAASSVALSILANDKSRFPGDDGLPW